MPRHHSIAICELQYTMCADSVIGSFATHLVKEWCELDKKYINRTAMVKDIAEILSAFSTDVEKRVENDSSLQDEYEFHDILSKIQNVLFANLRGCDAVYTVMEMGNREILIYNELISFFSKLHNVTFSGTHNKESESEED